MKEKIYVIIIGIVLLLSGFSLLGTSKAINLQTSPTSLPSLPFSSIIYVDDDNTEGPWDGTLEYPYQYIQDGITNAITGDTIYVFSGIYFEEVTVDKSLTILGEDVETTIVDGENAQQVFHILADLVNITAFTVQNGMHGIHLEGASSTCIDHCILTATMYGITPRNSPDTIITACFFHDLVSVGVLALSSSDVQSINCTFYAMQSGVYHTDSSSGLIRNCQMDNITMIDLSNGGSGVYLENSPGATIENCSISNCSDYGIYLYFSAEASIRDCILSDNTWNPDAQFPSYYHSIAVSLVVSPDCVMTNCSIRRNDNGLFVGGGSTNLLLRDNAFEQNTEGSFDTKAGAVEDFYLDIDTSNTIDGIPIVYLIGASDLTIDDTWSIGYLGLVSCTNIIVTNREIQGMLMVDTSDSLLTHVDSHHSKTGFMIFSSPNCDLVNCSAYNTSIGFFGSSSNMIDCVTYNNNEYGFFLVREYEEKNKKREPVNGGNITTCSAYQNRIGLYEEKGSFIQGCQVYDNTEYGCLLSCTAESTEYGSVFRDNRFFNNTYNFYAEGWEIPGFLYHDIDTSNTADGKPIYYLVEEQDRILDGTVEEIGPVMLIMCDNITVRNIEVTGNKQGVMLVATQKSLITNCSFSKNYDGIWLYTSSRLNTITNCDCYFNQRGIAAQEYASYNEILNCDLSNNSDFGYWSQVTEQNKIIGCIINNNGYSYSEDEDVYPLSLQYGGPGVMIHYKTPKNLIENCTIANNYEGIYVFDESEEQTVRNCVLYNNTINGLCLREETGCLIENCTAYENTYGFSLDTSPDNVFSGCSAYDNEYGFYITSSSNNNLFYHNNVYGNQQNAYDQSHNNWDNGYPSGGNYWDDYTGVDADGDGIGDTPYNIPGGTNKDNYPFMNANGWIEPEDTEPPQVMISKPEKAVYLNDKKILPFFITVIIKKITIEVNASDNQSGIDYVEFYIDDTLQTTDNSTPYTWLWDLRTPLKFRHQIKIIAYDTAGNDQEADINVWKFL